MSAIGQSTSRVQCGKVDWLRLEQRLRESLKGWADYEAQLNAAEPVPEDDHPAVKILQAISDIVGEETGRGFPLDAQP